MITALARLRLRAEGWKMITALVRLRVKGGR